MNRLDLHTPDITAENVAKIAALFPNCVTEVRANDTRNLSSSFIIHNSSLKMAIDFDLLRQELSGDLVEGPQERYRLDWPGKREALALANTPIRKTLRPCREESVDFDTTEHLYIEGDNLDALKLLQETYLGKVKMIYIDPPYNTGNDFIYDDNFSMSREDYAEIAGERDEEGRALFDEEKWKQNSSSKGRFHSEWLSMMYPRLKLARNLLREDGVIFVSIDDGEVANLRKLCDEIFGEVNFVAQIVWQKRYSRENRGSIGDVHEYILVFSRGKSSFESQSGKLPLTEEQAKIYRNPNNDPKGRWRGIPMTAQGFRPNQMYEIVSPSGKKFTPPEGRCWSTVEPQFQKLVEAGRIYFGASGDTQPQVIRYLSEVDGLVPWTWLPHDEGGHTDESMKEIINIFGRGFGFETPKPRRLINRLLQIASKDREFIILDFFSGSATTAHAVMQLNAEDGGRRRHIMVQLPEPCAETSEAFKAGYPTIAEIGKERIRRAGTKVRAELEAKLAATEEGSEEHQTLSDRLAQLDIGFRVLKIDSSNLAEVHHEPDQVDQGDLLLHIDNIKPDRSAEDLLFQILLDWGVDLSLPITEETVEDHRVFFVDDNALAACFDTGLDEPFVKALAKRTPLRAVFRDSGYATDAVKINIEQIFKALSPHTEIKTI
jgi:adenine-specific DNA-methyltransferase